MRERWLNRYEKVGDFAEKIGTPFRFAGQVVRNALPDGDEGIPGAIIEGIALIPSIPAAGWGISTALLGTPLAALAAIPLTAIVGMHIYSGIAGAMSSWYDVEEARYRRIQKIRRNRRG